MYNTILPLYKIYIKLFLDRLLARVIMKLWYFYYNLQLKYISTKIEMQAEAILEAAMNWEKLI